MNHRRNRAGRILLATVFIVTVVLLLTVVYGVFLWRDDRSAAVKTLEEASEVYSGVVFSSGSLRQEAGASPTVYSAQALSADAPIIVLDPGHGLGDPGCESDYLEGTEAQTVLEITLLLKEKLEAGGWIVHLTHDGVEYPSASELGALADQYALDYRADRILEDGYYSPYERTVYASICNAMEPLTLFLSLHVNALPEEPQVSRCEIYYCGENPYLAELDSLALSLAGALGEGTRTEASGYDEAFITTKYVTFPSILIEMGYATNPQDAENLGDSVWRESFCDTLVEQLSSWAKSCEVTD